jgi:hypothetical protein
VVQCISITLNVVDQHEIINLKKDELDGKIWFNNFHGAHGIGKKSRFVNLGINKMWMLILVWAHVILFWNHQFNFGWCLVAKSYISLLDFRVPNYTLVTHYLQLLVIFRKQMGITHITNLKTPKENPIKKSLQCLFKCVNHAIICIDV